MYEFTVMLKSCGSLHHQYPPSLSWEEPLCKSSSAGGW